MDAPAEMLPEHRAAWQALRRLASGMNKGAGHVPVVLHGNTGTGKTYLLDRLSGGLIAGSSGSVVTEAAAELGRELLMPPMERRARVRELLHADLFVLEDLQHLPPAASDEVAHIIDHRQARRKANIVTANTGPAGWNVSARLAGRLMGGLVVGIPALSVESRRAVAVTVCGERKIAVEPAVFDWLTRHGGGLRSMLGDINRLESLAKTFPGPLTLPVVRDALAEPPGDADGLFEELSGKVEQRFRVSRKMLAGPSRLKNIAWPRQVAMYLAREAGMSLADIGERLGRRDHSTVRHGVEKVRGELAGDPGLSEWVREVIASHGEHATRNTE